MDICQLLVSFFGVSHMITRPHGEEVILWLACRQWRRLLRQVRLSVVKLILLYRLCTVQGFSTRLKSYAH